MMISEEAAGDPNPLLSGCGLEPLTNGDPLHHWIDAFR